MRASEETEQWSDSWGYICDDSDSSTHKRARTGAHTHSGACGQRAALTLEMLTFRWKKHPWINRFQLERRKAVEGSLHLPSPCSFLQALPVPDRRPPLPSLSFPLEKKGQDPDSREALKESGSVSYSEICRAISSILPVEKEKPDPFLAQSLIYSREGHWRSAQGSPSTPQSSRIGALSHTELVSHGHT